jgi:hypothetical protein
LRGSTQNLKTKDKKPGKKEKTFSQNILGVSSLVLPPPLKKTGWLQLPWADNMSTAKVREPAAGACRYLPVPTNFAEKHKTSYAVI